MYKITYNPLVSKDVDKISPPILVKIHSAIEDKLTTYPESYGKPLRRNLKGHWKLRIGDYRVIFKIEKPVVKILMIEHRAIVYKYITARIKRLSSID